MERHPLEDVFEFDNPAFRSFMHVKKLTPEKLERFHKGMADSDNPLVRYTAGWALAELGLFRNYRAENEGLTIEQRNEALDAALACWKKIDDFAAFGDSQPTEDRRLGVQGFDIRRRQAMAYIPTMRLGAASLAKEWYTEQETQHLRKETLIRAVHIGRVIAQLPERTDRQRTRRAGLANEALCGLVDLSMPSQRFAPSPASIRHDLHVESYRRSDFMVIGDGSARKIMQQVKPDVQGRIMDEGSRMMITPRHDLLPPGFLNLSSATVLEELNQQVANGVKPWELDLLAEPGQRMEARVEAFQAAA